MGWSVMATMLIMAFDEHFERFWDNRTGEP